MQHHPSLKIHYFGPLSEDFSAILDIQGIKGRVKSFELGVGMKAKTDTFVFERLRRSKVLQDKGG